MELIELITGVNDLLEKSIFFVGLKFILGVMLIVLALDVALLVYVLVFKDRYYHSWVWGHGIPSIVNTMNRRWRIVVSRIKSDKMEHKKKAVIESGDMLYEILEKIGYEGASLDEMLGRMIGLQLANIDELKKASKIKNIVVNDKNYRLTDDDAIFAVKAFGEALEEHETIKSLNLE